MAAKTTNRTKFMDPSDDVSYASGTVLAALVPHYNTPICQEHYTSRELNEIGDFSFRKRQPGQLMIVSESDTLENTDSSGYVSGQKSIKAHSRLQSLTSMFKKQLFRDDIVPQSTSVRHSFDQVDRAVADTVPARPKISLESIYKLYRKHTNSSDLEDLVFSPSTHRPSTGDIPLINLMMVKRPSVFSKVFPYLRPETAEASQKRRRELVSSGDPRKQHRSLFSRIRDRWSENEKVQEEPEFESPEYLDVITQSSESES